MIARRYLVSGRVQGVYFRWFTQQTAQELGLSGWVRNLPDGRVEAWAEGPEKDVEALKAKISQGPSMAVVTELEEFEEEPSGDHSGFSITY